MMTWCLTRCRCSSSRFKCVFCSVYPVRLVWRFGETPMSWLMLSNTPAPWVGFFLHFWQVLVRPGLACSWGLGLPPRIRQVLRRHRFVL